MIYSTPSYLTSVPLYFATITLSPFFTFIGSILSSIFLPGPTSITSAICGFSCAFPANIIPLLVVSSAFFHFYNTLFPNGLIMLNLPPLIFSTLYL